MENMFVIVPHACSLKEFWATVIDLENFIKGSVSTDRVHTPQEELQKWLNSDEEPAQ
jgi:hypothetical protein